MSDEPRLEIIKLPDLLGAEWRAERARQRDEARRRYRDHLTATLAAIDAAGASSTTVAEAILDALFVITRVEGDGPCSCSCHPRLPDTDLHDYGFGCPCQQTAVERHVVQFLDGRHGRILGDTRGSGPESGAR